MAGAGRVTAALGDWLTAGNSNSVSGGPCLVCIASALDRIHDRITSLDG